MSFRMEVRVDQILEEGSYQAVLKSVAVKDTKFGERLMWTFQVPEENAEVVGFTSMSPSTKGNAFLWATAIMGVVDQKMGWGPEDVTGGKCTVVLEVIEDSLGGEKNKVVKVKPLKQKELEPESPEASDFEDIPF